MLYNAEILIDIVVKKTVKSLFLFITILCILRIISEINEAQNLVDNNSPYKPNNVDIDLCQTMAYKECVNREYNTVILYNCLNRLQLYNRSIGKMCVICAVH